MKDRRFHRLWASATVSAFGDRVSELALPLIAVVALDATPAQAGLLTAAIWTPNLLGLLIGSWVDRRTHRRRILVAADLLRAAVLLSLPAAHWLGVVTFAQLIVVALLSGLGQVLFMAAYQSFFVTLVPPDRYVDANSKLSLTDSASQIAGPPLAGVLVQAVTAAGAILADALSFLASAALLSRIRTTPAAPARDRTPLLSDARDGLRYVLTHPYLRPALACVTTVNFFTFVAAALFVLFASRTLGLPSGLIGLAFGLAALGGLVGALLAPSLSHRYGPGPLACLGAVLFPAPIALTALASGPRWQAVTVAVLFQSLSAAGVMLLDINLNAVQTAVTADHMRSRASGVFATVNYGIRPLGALTGGFLGGWIGIRPTLVVAGVGGSLACLWLIRSPVARVRSVAELSPAGTLVP